MSIVNDQKLRFKIIHYLLVRYLMVKLGIWWLVVQLNPLLTNDLDGARSRYWHHARRANWCHHTSSPRRPQHGWSYRPGGLTNQQRALVSHHGHLCCRDQCHTTRRHAETGVGPARGTRMGILAWGTHWMHAHRVKWPRARGVSRPGRPGHLTASLHFPSSELSSH